MKKRSTTVFHDFEIPFEKGPLKCTVIYQVILYPNKDGGVGVDQELLDYVDVSFMDVPIDSSYKAFNQFTEKLEGLGINFRKLVDQFIDDKIDQDLIDKLKEEAKPTVLG